VYEKAISNTIMQKWSKFGIIPSNGKSMCKVMSKAIVRATITVLMNNSSLNI
jgi:hypothetical protein